MQLPYRVIAEEVGLSEAEALDILREVKAEGVLRQVSAIFDTRTLGYKSSLVAAVYDEDGLDAGAEIVNGHPGVSHNYRRNHSFNLWYTIAVPPESDIEAHVERLHDLSGSNVAVVVSDTLGRAWRTGQTDVAIGCAGIVALDDHAGRVDDYGNELAVTAPAVADEVASAADLVTQATSAPNTYVFAELLAHPNIQALAQDSQFASALQLLEIFAWGTWESYQSEEDSPSPRLYGRSDNILTRRTAQTPRTCPLSRHRKPSNSASSPS